MGVRTGLIVRGGLFATVAMAVWAVVSSAALGAPGVSGLAALNAALTKELAAGSGAVAQAGVGVSVSHSPASGSVAIGQSLTYLVKVSNAGPRTALGVRVTVSFPAGFTPAAPVPAGCLLQAAAAPGSGPSYSCTVGAVRPSTARALQGGQTFSFAGSLSTPGQQQITATASTTTPDASTADDTAGDTTVVRALNEDNTVIYDAAGNPIWLGNNVDGDGDDDGDGGGSDNDGKKGKGKGKKNKDDDDDGGGGGGDLPECSDGVDNDDDLQIDDEDEGCEGADDDSEAGEITGT